MPSFPYHSLLLKVALLAMVANSGILLGVLQLGVWANMFNEYYGQTQSVSLSSKWTLDSNNRCLGCELVSELDSVTRETLRDNLSFAFDTKLLNETVSPITIQRPIFLGRLYFQKNEFSVLLTDLDTPPPKV